MSNIQIALDVDDREKLEQIKAELIRRNIARTRQGHLDFEKVTYKSIFQRGIAAVHRELINVI